MVKEEYKKINFYAGADYGLDPNFADEYSTGIAPGTYGFKTGQFGITTDPRTSAQLREVTSKLNTGAKVIEVEGLQVSELESIPKQHFKEINRLKKLVGADLTFHGPVIEPTGVSRQGWEEHQREQAERQMWSAVEKAHELEPKGNIVVTFHSSNGLPDPQTRIIDEKTGKEQIKEFWVVDEKTGNFSNAILKPDYFKGEEAFDSMDKQVKAINNAIDKQNKDDWYRRLQGVSFHANQGSQIVDEILREKDIEDVNKKLNEEGKTWAILYKDYLGGVDIKEQFPGPTGKIAEHVIKKLSHGDIYLRDAYQDLQTLFNQSYETALRNNNKEDLEKLDKFRNELKSKLKYIEDPARIDEFSEVLVKGVNVMRAIQPPKSIKPLREFAVDKASDTFTNLAFHSFKKFGDSSPIISIENPPAGMGLARAEDLKELVEVSRKKLTSKLIESGMGKGEAASQAEKLIGATWDVGHINMIRKYGYSDKHLINETEKIGPYVKHVHLSDNFGMEHTELPMGMGNVPTKQMLEIINKYNDKVKKIIETGGAWFRDFKTSPFGVSLKAFGSPIYSMKMAPYWNQAYGSSGGYFSGYGQVLPEQHFNIYGAGFATLPPELGGQMSGRSRLSGTPTE
jgi:sugar phosphate isomerase/epimerase